MEKERKIKNKNIDIRKIFEKVMIGILVLLMLLGTCSSCIFALMN